MTPERWEKVEALFESALTRAPAERPGFLDEACRGDGDLRRSVEELLASDDEKDEFIEDVVAAGVDLWTEAQLEGRRVGAFRLVERIGYGGMGVVYLAERADREYEQRVAVKVIRPGLDGGEILERFRGERQILAGFEHPNIARLIDGGTTHDGRPYLVMEYIEGQPIDRYCDERRLGVDERLELFRSVCDAVQYAHQHLVIHRDLKPSNILVTGDGTVKLLDFGIARILSPVEADAGFEPTATGDRPLTLTYASPEQIRGERVTMASDVYSLGVVLFELLTGRRPLELSALAPQEAMLRLSEGRRPAPSNVVTLVEEGYDPGSASRARATRPDRLRRRLAGDLDVIVATALHRDRTRRYGSAVQLSDDLGRHLAGRPVAARPDSFGYRTSKFIRRNRWPLVVATAFLAFATASWVDRAQQAARIAEERDKARQVADFLVGIFEVSDPARSRGESVTARELLEEGAKRLELDLRDQPLMRAAMSDTMSRAYKSLGLHQQAHSLAETALAARRRELGGSHADVAGSLATLGAVLEAEADYKAAEERFREALRIYAELDQPEGLAEMNNNLGLVLHGQGRYSEAEPHLREALEIYRELHGDAHPTVTLATGNLALLLEDLGDYDEAEQLMTRALGLARQVYDEPHPEIALRLNNLAVQRVTRGDYDEAERLHRQALDMRRKVLDPEHPDLQQSLNNLASVVFEKGDYKAAGALFQEAYDLARARLGEDHPDVTASASNLAAVLNKQGDFAGVEKMTREVLRLRRRQLGDETKEVAFSMNNLAAVLFSREKYDEAERYYEEALALRRKLLGEDHKDVASSLSNLALLHLRRGELDRATSRQEQALAIFEKNFGEENPDVARALASLADVHAAAGRAGEAEAAYRRAIALQRRLLKEGHPNLAISLNALGELLVDLGRCREAEDVLNEALEIYHSAFGDDHWRTAVTHSALGACFAVSGRAREGEEMMAGALEILEQARGPNHPLTRKTRARLEALRLPSAPKR